MASISIDRLCREPLTEGDAAFAPPSWVGSLVRLDRMEAREHVDGINVGVSVGQDATFVRVRVIGAVNLDPLCLQRKTVQAYGLVADVLRNFRARHPVRFWNHIPDIHGQMDGELSRYMVFNAGRYAAFHDWFGVDHALGHAVPTATGVGHNGHDLIIEALATDQSGLHIQNPRQHQPSSYSRRYGPFPPCFARASLINFGNESWAFIGGTASVRGEASLHPGDPVAQTEETFCNLASIIRASFAASGKEIMLRDDSEVLANLSSVRVYSSVSLCRDDEIVRLVQQRLSHLHDIEFLRADICRPELLTEIEGVVKIGLESRTS